MTQHARCRSSAEHVGVIDVRTLGAQRMREREHFAARAGADDPPIETNGRIDQFFETKALRHGRDEQQPGIRDEVRVIEDRVDPVERGAILVSLEVSPAVGMLVM